MPAVEHKADPEKVYQLLNFREALGYCFTEIPELKTWAEDNKPVKPGTARPGTVEIYHIYLGSEGRLLTDNEVNTIQRIAGKSLPPAKSSPSLLFKTPDAPTYPEKFYRMLSELELTNLQSITLRLTELGMSKTDSSIMLTSPLPTSPK